MKYTGYVYKCLCLETNKVYIGITTETVNKRRGRHIRESFNPKSYSYNHHFHRAIRKYGPDQFEWTQLECVISESRENLKFCLKQLEIKYVSLFNSYRKGYNSTLGGDNSESTKKSVKVYLKDGTEINEFNSIQDTADYFQIKRYSVGKCCNKVQKYVRSKDFGILIFRFSDDLLTGDDLRQAIASKNAQRNTARIEVSAYYADTQEFIKKFDSYTEAAQYFNIDPTVITAFFKKHYKYAGVYNGRQLTWKHE